jgi:nucleoside-diphosphate-sugar epimerase
MQSATRTALVIGITGSVGREIAEALLRRDWQVRALHRDPSTARISGSLPNAVQWIKGDAMKSSDVVEAAHGTQLIVHAANPPNYRNWRGLVLPMLDNTIAAARLSNARILLPANIYNFGCNAAPVLKENSPQIPTTRKGQVRVEMELKLQKASLYGVRSLVVRAGDFIGPGAGRSWLS